MGDQFKHGLAMLKRFNGSPFTTQLLGYCKQSYVTEYHDFGDASNLNEILSNEKLHFIRDSIKARFGFCINYVQILNFLHTQPEGAFVLCDSNSLRSLLRQFVVRSDFQLLANDLDNLPIANRPKNITIKCSKSPIQATFVAPEQRWKESFNYVDELASGYDEKTDIWKIPDMCDFFVSTPGGITPGLEALRHQLTTIHGLCKRKLPSQRPSAEQVLQEYTRVFNGLR